MRWLATSKSATEEVQVPESAPALRTDVRPTIRAGLWVVAISIVGFGLWAGLTPLASGVHVMGKVAVETDRKTVQHFEGGIVKEILVKEGSRVSKDDPLVILEGTQARASREAVLARTMLDAMLEARLLAERRGDTRFEMPEELRPYADDARLQTIRQDQANILIERRRQIGDESATQRQRLEQVLHQIEGIEGTRKANATQIALVEKENAAMQSMFAQGFATATQARSLERDLSQLHGQRQSLLGEMQRLRSLEVETRQQLGAIQATYQKDVSSQLDAARARLRESREMLSSADDMLRRVVVRAPQAGQVVGLQTHTVGGVVAGGSPMMYIVPENEKLVLEAQLKPLDASYVQQGMPAEVKFSGLPKRTTPLLRGHVTSMATDTLVDPNTRMPFYLVRVEVGPDQMRLMEGSAITPGMPVEVLLEADKRTVLEYLLAPWTDLFRKAMREH